MKSIQHFLKSRPHAVPVLISVVMLLACLHEWPYGYYTLMRWIVCGTAIFTAYRAFVDKGRKPSVWMWIFIFIAFLFNPIAPIPLEREMWVIIDIVVAVIMVGELGCNRGVRG